MAQAPKKITKKRQLTNKQLPLLRTKKPVKKASKSLQLWFGQSHRLELKIIPAKRLTKKQRQAKEKRDKYITFITIAVGLIGVVYFSVLLAAPIPQPPALAAPASEQAPITSDLTSAENIVPAEPVQLKIPAINIDTSIITVGKNADNTLEVPSVYDKAGWYKLGPKPGEAGAAVIVGHVTSKSGKAIFWNLSTMQAGDLVEIVELNGKSIKFQVTNVKQYPQDQFPTNDVYGQTEKPTLRLITCGGTYNRFTRRYSHNTVVFAELIY